MSERAGKPGSRKLGWRLIESRCVFSGQMSDLREDHLELPDGGKLTYQYEERAQSVVIVPVTAGGEIVLIRQYRYPVDMWCMETPAGGCHDTGDASLEEVVRKELREEAGAEVESVQKIGEFFSSPSFSDELSHVFIAWGTRLAQQPEQEETEEIRVRAVRAAEALRLARSGEMKTAPCALALWWSEEHLRQRGFLK